MISKIINTVQEKIAGSNSAAVITGLAFFIIITIFSFTRAYNIFELKLYDLRFILKPEIAQWGNLTFIDIDDNSINGVGEFPWPRNVYASGLAILEQAGVRQVAFDIQFPDESPRIIDRVKYRDLQKKALAGRHISPDELSDAVLNNDAVFGNAIRSMGNAVIPYSFQKEKIAEASATPERRKEIRMARESFSRMASIPVPEGKEKQFADLVDPERIDIMYPIPEIIRSTGKFGFVDSDFDIDGTSRKIRLVRNFNNRLYFHMGLVMLMNICDVTMEGIEVNPGRNLVLRNATNPMTFKKGDITIPINNRGMMYINWSGDLETSFNHISFYHLIEYPLVKDEIYDFFDAQELQSGSRERSAMYGKLAQEQAHLQEAATPEAKHAAWTAITTLRKKIRTVESGYASPLRKQLADVKKRLSEDRGNPQLIDAAKGLENYLKAVRLVLDVDTIKNHAGIVGYTATASQDIGVTPLSSNYMMVGTYHNIINTVLQGEFIRKTGRPFNILLMLVLAVGIAVVVQRLDARKSLIAIGASFLAINILNILIFAFFNVLIDQMGTSLALLLPSLTIGGMKFIREESQRRFIKLAFSHYLSPKVIENIIKDPDSFKLGGESRTITTFFSDIAKFSTISEKLAPTELVSLLNEYLSAMTDILLKYDGTIDKYEGDAIMAFFGAPHFFRDHAVKACYTALEMQKTLADMRLTWRKQGRDELFVRIGMNTGEAVVGNMGSRTRMDYTVMGDSVNLASRLEGANKYYNTGIMISENTYLEAKDRVEVRKLDMIRVVGKEEPITVYELLSKKGELSDQLHELMEKYDHGLELFGQREWDRAKASFRAGLRIIEDDGPCRTYIDRCTEFSKNPPTKNWDGVYRLKSK